MKSWILLAVALTTLPSTAHADEADQERITLAWVEVHNSGSVEAMAAFRQAHFRNSDAPDWQQAFERLVDRLGTLDVMGVMVEEAGEITLVAHSETRDRMRLVFEFHDDDPDQIAEIRLAPDSGGRGGGLPPLELVASGWPQRTGEIDAYLTRLAADDRFSGSVMIVERGKVRFEGAYGLASREFQVPNTLDTRFDVGSFNKDYTRLAILQLMVAGKLALSDTVGTHLPDYPNQEVRERVTIQQLIDHTSGLGDYFTDEWDETPMGKLREISDYIPIWGPMPLEGEPGAREKYSNFGYTVLGAVIEARSGTSYPEYVQAHIFEPAGMRASGFFETDRPEPDVAVGYTRFGPDGERGETLYKNIYLEPAKGGPWGKAYSPVRDLYRFFEAMFANELLPTEHNWLDKGWEIGGTALAGGGPGLNAYLGLEDGVMILVMANLDPPIAGQVESVLRSALP